MGSVNYAPHAWKLLNGVFCIYKPADVPMGAVKRAIKTKICAELNCMEIRPPKSYVKIEKDLSVNVKQSFADHPLVVGSRYQVGDVKLATVSRLAKESSGVCVMGINDGVKSMKTVEKAMHLRAYHVKGELGIATDNSGKIVQKSTWKHVTLGRLEKLLAVIQADHQKQQFLCSGIDIQTQAGFELASKGLIRPKDTDTPPLIYGIKCVSYDRPHFTLQVHCINENDEYFKELVNDIGIQLKTNATCSGIRCLRYGHFRLEHALLRKHWTAEHIINNISKCEHLATWDALNPESAEILYTPPPREPDRVSTEDEQLIQATSLPHLQSSIAAKKDS